MGDDRSNSECPVCASPYDRRILAGLFSTGMLTPADSYCQAMNDIYVHKGSLTGQRNLERETANEE